jgi:hypothetical protein
MSLFLASGLLAQTPVTGTSMRVGTGNVGANSRAAALGESNNVTGWGNVNSFATGSSNSLHNSYSSFAFGSSNNGGYQSYQLSFFGHSNYVAEAQSSSSFGQFNSYYGLESYFMATTVLLAGSHNRSFYTVASSFVAGRNNELSALHDWDWDPYYPTAYDTLRNASVFGEGNITLWSNSTVIGRWNDITIPRYSGLLFAIGNGVSNEDRSNVLEVYADGTVRMPRQGDVLMGIYGE